MQARFVSAAGYEFTMFQARMRLIGPFVVLLGSIMLWLMATTSWLSAPPYSVIGWICCVAFLVIGVILTAWEFSVRVRARRELFTMVPRTFDHAHGSATTVRPDLMISVPQYVDLTRAGG